MMSVSERYPKFLTKWAVTMTLHIIGAGFDTLGTTLASCIIFIATTPDVQQRLQAELDVVKESSGSDIQNHNELVWLPYLQSCISETMRLKPVVGISQPRLVPASGFVLHGRYLPPGTTVGANSWVIHRSPAIFGADADEFRPQRYLEASSDQRAEMEGVNLSFGGANRSCPGKNLAWLLLRKCLAVIFVNFEVTVVADKNTDLTCGQRYKEECFFVVKISGAWCTLKRRGHPH
jgi:cytochrome P450